LGCGDGLPGRDSRLVQLAAIRLWLRSRHRDPGRPVGTAHGARHHGAQSDAGAFAAIASFAGMLLDILFARIMAEFILMVFRINEHLAAIRNRGGM
jgi:hypothetical protein